MFIKYNENPRDNFRAGDCVIRAISVVTGDPWEKIYVELCAEGYFMGDWGNNNAVACVSGDWIDSWDSGSVVPIYYYTKEGD